MTLLDHVETELKRIKHEITLGKTKNAREVKLLRQAVYAKNLMGFKK